MRFFAAPLALEQALQGDYPDAVAISPLYPLRCNLTGAENVALVRQYHQRERRIRSMAEARELLVGSGYGSAADKRDGDMSEAERFATKVARASILGKALAVIDRPGAMLPNMDYAPWIFALMPRFSAWFGRTVVLDYEWNRPLYRGYAACEASSSK